MIFTKTEHSLIFRRQGETVCLEVWGEDSFRIRATRNTDFTGRSWALDEPLNDRRPATIHIDGETHTASIRNGRLTVTVNAAGVLTFLRDGKQFLREYYRNYFGTESEESCCLKVVARD